MCVCVCVCVCVAAIISMTRDVKDQIRKEAFAEHCDIRNFRREQRIKLLRDGLNDRWYRICLSHTLFTLSLVCVCVCAGVRWCEMRV